MNFLRKLFGGKAEPTEEEKKEAEARNFDVLKYDGVRAMRVGQWTYAVRCFRHALEIQEDLEIRDYLSQVLIRSDELLPAYEELRKLAEARPDNQEVFVRMAHVAYMMENYQAMSDACEKAMLIDNNTPVVYYQYAQASHGMDDDVNAIAMLTRAISLQDDYADAYQLRGKVLLEMGDVEGAEKDAQWLMEHLHDDEDVMLMMASVKKGKSQPDEALLLYNKVIGLNPFNIEAYKARGELYLQQGNKEAAAKDAAKVLELDPKANDAISGNYSTEGIEQKVEQAYKNMDPYGVFS